MSIIVINSFTNSFDFINNNNNNKKNTCEMYISSVNPRFLLLSREQEMTKLKNQVC